MSNPHTAPLVAPIMEPRPAAPKMAPPTAPLAEPTPAPPRCQSPHDQPSHCPPPPLPIRPTAYRLRYPAPRPPSPQTAHAHWDTEQDAHSNRTGGEQQRSPDDGQHSVPHGFTDPFRCLTRIIHERFCCNRRSAAPAREASFVKCEAQDGKSVSVSSHAKCRYASRGTRFRAISRRTVINNAG